MVGTTARIDDNSINPHSATSWFSMRDFWPRKNRRGIPCGIDLSIFDEADVAERVAGEDARLNPVRV